MKVIHALGILTICGSGVVGMTAAVDDVTSAGWEDGIASIAESDGVTLVPHSAPERPTPREPKPQTGGIADRDRLTGDWGGIRTQLEDKGVDINANLNAVYMKNTRGGVSTHGSSLQTLLNLNFTLDTEKLLSWHGGTFFVNFLHQTGQSPGDEVGSIHALNPVDADGRTQISEIWYEQKLLDDKLRVKVGKIDVNSELAVSEFGSEFLNGGLIVSPNNPIPTYPDSSFGGLAVYNFTENCYVALGVFDGAAQSGYATGELGPKTLFGKPRDLYLVGETGGSWQIQESLPGRLIIGLWHNTGEFANFTGGTQDGATGAYLAIEQMVYRENPGNTDDLQGLGLFLLYGYGDSRVIDTPNHVAIGDLYHGVVPGRDDDALGIGASYLQLSSKAGFTDDHEVAIEAFYEIRPIPSLSLKPDIQYILNPGGTGAKDAVVVGVSVNVDF